LKKIAKKGYQGNRRSAPIKTELLEEQKVEAIAEHKKREIVSSK